MTMTIIHSEGHDEPPPPTDMDYVPELDDEYDETTATPDIRIDDSSPVARVLTSIMSRLTWIEARAGRRMRQADVLSLIALGELSGLTKGDASVALRYGSLEGRRLARIGSEPWPARAELPQHPKPESLTLDMLPAPLRTWIAETARAACMPLEMIAIPALVGLSSLIARHGRIVPEPTTRWEAVPNLWGAIVARPGTMKSHALGAALNPISRLASSARDAHEAAAEKNRAKMIRLKGRLAALGRQKDASEDEITTTLRQIDELQCPERRYRTNDPTVEKLGELLRENPRGLLLVRDELTGWLRTLDKPGREGDREFYLESWDGDGSYTVDRIGRGTLHVPALCLSVIGCMQPGKLEAYRDSAIEGGVGDDGLLQRFQLLIWPDSTGDWIRPDQAPSNIARGDAFAVFDRLDQVHRERRKHPSRFSADAQIVVDAWRDALEVRLRSDELHRTPAFEAHISKYRGLMPSLALIFHMIEIAVGGREAGDIEVVPRRHAEMAIRWCSYLESHAKKVYDVELAPGVRAARTIAAKIKSGAVVDGQSVRDLYRTGWTGVRTQNQAEVGLAELERIGWIRLETVSTGGRNSAVIRINPALLADVGSCR